MPFELPALPYPYDALEPHIDKETMNIHLSGSVAISAMAMHPARRKPLPLPAPSIAKKSGAFCFAPLF